MESIPTYIGQEIAKCAKAIKEARWALANSDLGELAKANWRRRLKAQQEKLRKLATKKMPKGE